MKKMLDSSNITALLACEKSVQYKFCAWCEQFGASKRTLIDVLLLSYRPIDRWRIAGVEKMLRCFAPEYKGKLLNYYEEVGMSEKFYDFMREHGDMCRTSTWSKFRNGWFKQWEIIGLNELAGRFLDELKNKVEP